jgi:hypothetical protein
VNPNVSVCVVIASLLDAAFEDGLRHEKVVLTLGQDSFGLCWRWSAGLITHMKGASRANILAADVAVI